MSAIKCPFTRLVLVAAVGLFAYQTFKKVKNYITKNSVKVIQVDTAPLVGITDEQLIYNLFLLSQQAFDNILRDNKATQQQAATLYSLFKQQKDGDADELEKNKEQSSPEKYAVWLQQVGKSDMQVMKEYILLVGQIDLQFNETVRGVASGAIKEINFHKADQNDPMARQVPTPKKPDNTEYERALSAKEKTIYEMFTQIKQQKDEAKLIELVKSGTLKPTETNKEGQTALLFAVDSQFSSATVSELISLGCDINSQDADGMTSLHVSATLGDKENFKLLLELGADPDICDEEGESVRKIVIDDKELSSILQQMMASASLATSMTKSQFEKAEKPKEE